MSNPPLGMSTEQDTTSGRCCHGLGRAVGHDSAALADVPVYSRGGVA
jgi:hypothetical protein